MREHQYERLPAMSQRRELLAHLLQPGVEHRPPHASPVPAASVMRDNPNSLDFAEP
jgi:hypothetical protein